MSPERPTVLVAHPYPDLYGADLMLLRSLEVLRSTGWDVVLAVPEEGPLLARLAASGLGHRIVEFPVLRKELLRPRGLVRLSGDSVSALRRLRRLVRSVAPDVVYVNTLTVPHWLLAARLEKVPAVCHVRELESQTGRLVATGLTAPLRLATRVVANSEATRSFLVRHHAALAGRTQVVYNGYDFPAVPSSAGSSVATTPQRTRITVVGRLSPRKGQDVAVRALGLLVAGGHDVELELVGSAFRGYEWYETRLAELAQDAGVADRLLLRGFRADVWPHLMAAGIVVVPSRLEPFGSVAVEALAAARPAVVSDVGGLPEIVRHGRTGLVIPPDDPRALADAVATLLGDRTTATELAQRGCDDVRDRFRLERYARELVLTLRSASGLEEASVPG